MGGAAVSSLGFRREGGAGGVLRLGVVGPGRVGAFWVRAAAAVGLPCAIAARDPARAPEDLRASTAAIDDLADGAWSDRALVVLAVPDHDVPTAWHAMAGACGRGDEGPICAHAAGALGADVLVAAGLAPARAAAIHPMFPFPARDPSPPASQVTLAVEASPAAVPRIEAVLERLGSPWFPLASANRALYHLACVVAANHLVTLASVAERLGDLATDGAPAARSGLRRLLLASADKVAASDDLALALSGPMVRGDRETITRHHAALTGRAAAFAPLYRALVEAALPLVPEAARAALTEETEEAISPDPAS